MGAGPRRWRDPPERLGRRVERDHVAAAAGLGVARPVQNPAKSDAAGRERVAAASGDRAEPPWLGGAGRKDVVEVSALLGVVGGAAWPRGGGQRR